MALPIGIPQKRPKKEGIYMKKRENERSKWHTSDLHLGN